MNVTITVADSSPAEWLPNESHLTDWFTAAGSVVDLSSSKLSIGVAILDESEARQANKLYREKDYATNVLSFPSELPEQVQSLLDEQPLGDLILCPAVIESQANSQRKTLQQHWAHLCIHGLFHLLGYDHQCKDSQDTMEALEIEALSKLGFPNPYVIS